MRLTHDAAALVLPLEVFEASVAAYTFQPENPGWAESFGSDLWIDGINPLPDLKCKDTALIGGLALAEMGLACRAHTAVDSLLSVSGAQALPQDSRRGLHADLIAASLREQLTGEVDLSSCPADRVSRAVRPHQVLGALNKDIAEVDTAEVAFVNMVAAMKKMCSPNSVGFKALSNELVTYSVSSGEVSFNILRALFAYEKVGRKLSHNELRALALLRAAHTHIPGTDGLPTVEVIRNDLEAMAQKFGQGIRGVSKDIRRNTGWLRQRTPKTARGFAADTRRLRLF